MFILLIIQRKNIWKKFKNFSLSYILEEKQKAFVIQ